MLSMIFLVGIWASDCIQTQISNVNQGFVKESYTFEKNGEFEFKRQWYRDSRCSEPDGTEVESGTVIVGENIDTIFHLGKVFEADFSTQKGIDMGAVAVSGHGLRVARGVHNSSIRNTMLSLFTYIKQ